MENENLLRSGDIKKLAWKFAIPSIISMVVWALYNLVDRIYVGNIQGVGSAAITGLGLTSPITTFAFAFTMLFSVGGATLISLNLGRGRKEKANQVFNQALKLSLISSILIMIVCWAFLKPLLGLLGADSETMPYAFAYISIVIAGFWANGLSFILIACLRSMGHPKVSTVFNLLGTIINVILDPILIFSFGMGIAGAAWATIFSQIVTVIAVIIYYRVKSDSFVLKIERPNFNINWKLAKKITQTGFAPFAVQLVASLIIIFLNQIMIKYGGNSAVASLTIVFGIQSLVFLPLIGYAQGQQPIIGFNYGAKAFLRVREVVRYGTKVMFLMGLIAFVLVQLFPVILVRLFTNDQALIDSTVRGLRIFLLMTPILGLQTLGANYFQFIGRSRMATVLSLLRQVIVFIPALIILPRIYGVDGVWYAGALADLLTTMITIFFFVKAVKALPKKNEVLSYRNEKLGEKLVDAHDDTGVVEEAARDGEIHLT